MTHHFLGVHPPAKVKGSLNLRSLFEGVIPNPAHFSRVRDLPPSTSWAGDPSLRLKSGSARDDVHSEQSGIQTEPLPRADGRVRVFPGQ